MSALVTEQCTYNVGRVADQGLGLIMAWPTHDIAKLWHSPGLLECSSSVFKAQVSRKAGFAPITKCAIAKYAWYLTIAHPGYNCKVPPSPQF